MAPDNLEKLFQSLNPAQCLAVETIDGPVMVVAGPGTGKTQILTLRAANILIKTDAAAENILALTFTEAAAANMRRRLVSLIGTSGYYVNIHTFHGFCNKLIREYPEYFPRIIGGAAATLSDQIGLVRKIIAATNLKLLKPFGNKYYYAAEILKNIRQLKNEGFGPDRFKKISDSPKNRELALIYQKYQRELDRKKRYDFEDMILETIDALKHNRDFLLDLREKYQYILVDEHQDTNGAQNKTLELLAGDDSNPNLFVVGDEKQAIFRFQGASIENFLYFKKRFPRAKLINLKQNYRSSQHILDAGHSLIEKNKAVLALTKLQAQSGRTALPGRAVLPVLPEKIKTGSFDRPETEYLFIAEKIKELIKQKTPPGEIAVLYRENKDAPAIADFLARYGVPHAVESDENALDDVEIKKLNILLSAIENFGDDEHLIKALHLDFLGVDPMALYKLPNQDISRLNLDIIKKLGIWKKLSYNTTFPKFFETVINESGFLKNLLSRPDYRGRLEKLNVLFSEIKNSAAADPDYNLSDYLNYLAVLKEHNLPLNSKTARTSGAVRLMTAHRAKGLEFDYVFIVGAYNGHWGNKRNRNYFDLPVKTGFDVSKLEKNEDERRLFYMALTRARKNVFITYSALSPEGREQVPSQFIGEIKPELKEEIAGVPYEAKLARYGSILLTPPKPTVAAAGEKTLVKDMFLKRGLSPTSLNNYLACPWRFFYVNLLRIPKTQNRHQVYGTAKHNAFQKFFDAKKENNKIGGKFLIDNFAAELKKLAAAPADRAILLQRGRESLAAYCDFYKNSWNYNTINEFKISGVDFSIGKNQTIRLTGKLDKLEFPNGSKRDKGEVMVVDYKTKAPESRNWILGKTKNSNGDYFRQLVFYKLLADSLPKKKFTIESGVIDFVEPDDKGRFRKESFEISAADVKELKETIARAADEIINLKFWASRCGQKDCEFCALRDLMPEKVLVAIP